MNSPAGPKYGAIPLLARSCTPDHLDFPPAGPSSSGRLSSSGGCIYYTITQYQSNTLLCYIRCLVAAGIKDMSRPAENISIPQNIGRRTHARRQRSSLHAHSFSSLCSCSPHNHWPHLGQVFLCHHARQLLARGGKRLRRRYRRISAIPSTEVSGLCILTLHLCIHD